MASITLAELRTFAERFVAAHLDAYTESLGRRRRIPGRKEINDPLWGTIGLTGPEVAVIDSPLVQRLRLIRQLGVVHWVYPGAVHTRFEHTLGVLHQVQHLCGAINNLATQQNQRELIGPSKVNLLRLAALLHDVGHAAFSHVSEHAIESLEAFSSLPADFAREHKVESKSLSEIFAYFAIRSPSMRRLITVLLDHESSYITLSENRIGNADALIEKLSRAIIGRSIDDDLPLLHEIISGPFDADKLDYFIRDARGAGTPSLLDISRLIQKLAIRQFDATELPGTTGRDVQARGRHHLVGIKWSGISVLDELHLARVLLYAKVYRHTKVVGIEQMVRAAFMTLAGATDPQHLLELVYWHTDDELLAMTAPMLAHAIGRKYEESDGVIRERMEKATAILRNIRLRRLSVKAFQLQRSYPADPLEEDVRQKSGLIDFREIFEQPVEMEAFRGRLVEEVERISQTLGSTPRNRVDLEGSITLRAIGKTPGGTQIGRAWLMPPSGAPLEFRNYLVNRTAWADSYLSDQPAGYIFADEDLADLVYIAVERLLRIDHQIRLPASAVEASKRNEEVLQGLKRSLAEAGYYRDAPFDIRPLPGRLSHADVARGIAEFLPKLEAYQAPVRVSEEGQEDGTPDAKVSAWLRQFDEDDDVECALRLLGSLRMISRRDTVNAIRTFITQHPEFEGALVVPFGSARDSAVIHGYFAGDLQGTYVSECLNLDEAVRLHRNRPIVLLDDFIGSGGQSRDVLAAGFGRDDLRVDLGEGRDLFTSDIQRFLTEARIAFVFTAAWDDGVEQMKRTTASIGLNATIFCSIGESEIPFMAAALEGLPSDQVDAFLERSKSIGRSLLDSESRVRAGENPDARRARLSGRALGYGNRGMLLVSPFNVPTQTFTPLWAHGMVGGVRWTPLMPRRKKV